MAKYADMKLQIEESERKLYEREDTIFALRKALTSTESKIGHLNREIETLQKKYKKTLEENIALLEKIKEMR